MNLDPTENQKMIAEMLKSFSAQHILPFRSKWDEEQFFPVDCFRKLGDWVLWVCWFLKNMEELDFHIMNT